MESRETLKRMFSGHILKHGNRFIWSCISNSVIMSFCCCCYYTLYWIYPIKHKWSSLRSNSVKTLALLSFLQWNWEVATPRSFLMFISIVFKLGKEPVFLSLTDRWLSSNWREPWETTPVSRVSPDANDWKNELHRADCLLTNRLLWGTKLWISHYKPITPLKK